MKKEAVNHSKMARLMRRLDVPRYAAIGLMESLWFTTANERPCGDIGKMSNEDIAIALDWRGDPDVLVDALWLSGWVDKHEIFRLVIHDWAEHAQDQVHSKLVRSRKYFWDGTRPKFNGLNKDERRAADLFYGSPPEDNGGQLFPDELSSGGQLVGSGGSLKETYNPTLPNPTQPIQTKTNEHPPKFRLPDDDSGPAVDDVRSCQPVEIAIPNKGAWRTKNGRKQGDIERINDMRQVLYDCMRFPTRDGPERPCARPDDVIVLRCLAAVGSTSTMR